MNDDLLKDLGKLAREQEDEFEHDPLAAELLKPLAPSFQDELQQKLAPPPPAVTAPKPPAKVIPLWRRMAPAALGIAAAAAVALFVITKGTPDPLPEYAMTVTGGDKEVRSMHPPSKLSLSPGSRFEVLLRPASPTASVATRVFLVQGGAAKPWDAPVEIAPSGSIRIAGETSKLFPGGPGQYGVLLLVGTQQGVDVDRAAAARIWGGAAAGAQVHRVDVTVTP